MSHAHSVVLPLPFVNIQFVFLSLPTLAAKVATAVETTGPQPNRDFGSGFRNCFWDYAYLCVCMYVLTRI